MDFLCPWRSRLAQKSRLPLFLSIVGGIDLLLSLVSLFKVDLLGVRWTILQWKTNRLDYGRPGRFMECPESRYCLKSSVWLSSRWSYCKMGMDKYSSSDCITNWSSFFQEGFIRLNKCSYLVVLSHIEQENNIEMWKGALDMVVNDLPGFHIYFINLFGGVFSCEFQFSSMSDLRELYPNNVNFFRILLLYV